MSLRVFTARLGVYRGADGLNITRAGNDPLGSAFAPSWGLLNRTKARQRQAKTLRGLGKIAEATAMEGETFVQYTFSFAAEMHASREEHPDAWTEVLARDEITLLCVCADALRCHRTLVAVDLGLLGAEYMGERVEAGLLPGFG